ncbi:DUF4412 domain-containing protein [Winogradskyella sp. DF17]|jgi:hypothetical protein|uniref:DUF4412 domain-containing protein n=1 Tax=Winogradskyella pelagia TaxID=2819984 RepID=A0ABS3T356_9FLAO|nr:DUF4412 domain-containing protein [Winogradskyella sp. DF17]MBO3117157.1 DUF4412 domain-containing protein [Winogradskyella sp. DF17]
MKKILLLSCVVVLSLVATAQEKLTEGVITTKQTISSDNPQMQAQLDAMGDMMSKTFFKGNNSRVEMDNPMTGPMTVISSQEKMKTLTLMDNPMMGKKFAMQDVEVTPETLENVKVEDGSATKTILGYSCKEKIVTVNQDGTEVKMSMFVTDQIVPVMTQQTASLGDKINGYPLYMVINMSQQGMAMTITMEVTDIDKSSVSDDKFDMTPPEGYTKMEGM